MSDYLEQAQEKYKNDEYEEALELCNKQIELGEDLVAAYCLRASIKYELAYDKENEDEIILDALKDAKIAIEQNPLNRHGYYIASLIYERLEEYENSIIAINKAIEYRSDDEELYTQRAGICAKLNRNKE